MYFTATIAEDDPQERSQDTWVDATRPWGEVIGMVRDASGRAVEGAVVLLQNLGGFGGRGKTDGDGRYTIPLLPCSRIPRWSGRGWPDAVVPDSLTTIYCAANAAGYCGSSVVEVEAYRGVVAEAPVIVLWRGGYVSGRTVDIDGNEVAARVRVVGQVSPQPLTGQLEALQAGHPAGFAPSEVGEGYRLGPIAPGTVEVWATAPGVGACSTLVTIVEGETTSADLSVNLTVHISGKVVDHSGGGVAGVQVVCHRELESPAAPGTSGVPDPLPALEAAPPMPGEDSETASLRATAAVRGKHDPVGLATLSPVERASSRGVFGTHTDDRGHFYFYGLQKETGYEVSIAGCRTDPAALLGGVRPSRGDVTLRMPLRFAVRGLVRDIDSGESVQACVVQVLLESSARYLARRLQLGLRLEGEGILRTGPSGEFETMPVFPGIYRLSFIAEGYEIAERTLAVDAETGCGDEAVQVGLRRAPAIAGTVHADVGTALLEVAVEAWCPCPAARRPDRIEWIGRLTAQADDAGAFRLEGLPAHEPIHIRARDQSGKTGQLTIELQPGEDRRVVIRMEPASALTVNVLPRSHGTCEGHPIRLVGIDDPDIDVALASDTCGSARIKNLPPGRYKVLAIDAREDRTRSDVLARIREISLGPGTSAVLEIEVPDVTMLKGTVSLDGNPTRVAKIGFGPIEGTADHFRPLLFEVTNGTFQGRVPPGTYHVHVRVPGRRFENPDPVVVPNVPTESLNLALTSEAAGARR